ncbi:peroxisome assembly factor 2 [Cephus cinctus]|uniref:Peroxisomal ATPase PEX6 n=1 Tax=Cephus cinctus TaxID=211228 RepID=A0AAJ7RM52_CEPCN|nr:peroxisome assembly factor 2 [Cephus cinctus]XP_015599525.1 peroxisome assembly factor 2 [Cephus cinctus]XP_024943035.1 peroxisome assembly factor 2 [Cephus cinctus]
MTMYKRRKVQTLIRFYNMSVVINNINLIYYLAKTLMSHSSEYLVAIIFFHYIYIKFDKLLKMKCQIQSVTDKTLKKLFNYTEQLIYIDCYSCAFGNPTFIGTTVPRWFYIVSMEHNEKYKIFIIPLPNVKSHSLIVSESTRFNIENTLHTNRTSYYFIFPWLENVPKFAKKATVSVIANPYDRSNDLIDTLLSNYFSEPRYLRSNDIFSISIRDYAPDYFYFSLNPNANVVFFKIKTIKVNDSFNNSDGCYIVRDKTTLSQEVNVHSHLPQKHSLDFSEELLLMFDTNNESEQYLCYNYPPSLHQVLENLESCILPFIQKDVPMDMRPVFLVEGRTGSGKSRLIQTVAERMGVNLLNVDFAEIQSLTAAQTEAKLRIVLHKAENCVPCILKLNNIQVFGKDAEGQKDERTISAFATELKKAYDKNLEYPLIIIATSDASEIPADLRRIFIESISLKNLDRNQRTETLLWLLASKCLKYEANISKIAGMCSDFVLADLEALILHAVKTRYRLMTNTKEYSSISLLHDDFVNACEYMQTMFSDQIGAPRVPTVHWEDIGGLADLKQEITRRIELPLLNTKGFGRSGLLLYGPPGTGKTLLAKAVATECQLHFLSVKGPELLNMYVGQSEKNVRQVFEKARSAAPCIIFFDELDSLAPNRGRSGDSGGVMDRIVSQLLAEMDGLESTGSIFIIGATNRPDLIDPALLRPGRFDKMLYVGIYSDRDSQLSVLRALTRKFKMENGGKELEKIVEQLPVNLTGADLYAVCSDAWLLAVRRIFTNNADQKYFREAAFKEHVDFNDGITVTLKDFLEAIRNLAPSVSREELKRYEKLRLQLSSS